MVTPTMNPTDNMKALYETFEKASTQWFDVWSKSPAFLGAMGKTLEAQLGMKANYDKFVQNALEAYRIPSARDIESLGDRIASLEERLAGIEEAVGTSACASEKK
jgi:hypothetical protein